MPSSNSNGDNPADIAKLSIAERQLRLEESRYRLEKEFHYLERWKVDVVPFENYHIEASKAAISFAQTTVKTGYILNGGALIALPTFVQALSIPIYNHLTLYVIAIVLFFLGLISSGIANVFYYLALASISSRSLHRREAQVLRLNEQHNPVENKNDHIDKLNTVQAKVTKENKRSKILQYIAFASTSLAILAFSIGAIVGAYLIFEGTI